MKALILAAGYAIRLYPLTLDNPKPLLDVGGKKIIDRIISALSAVKALDEVYVVTNSKFYPKFSAWVKTAARDVKITLVDDGTATNETRLGAIRDMDLVIKSKRVGTDFLVVAGDNLFELDMKDFIGFASARADGVSVALYDVRSLASATRYGVVSVDASGSVTEFEEKPEKPKSTLVSTGIYYFPKACVSQIDEYLKAEGAKNDAPGYYIKWLVANKKVYGFPFSQKWYDIGDIDSYHEADGEYKKKESR
jgi:glucose-1-phosphate thymidylyltransferase